MCVNVEHDNTLTGNYTLENANLCFGTNVILPNYLLALVFSKGQENFYDYETFLKLGYYILNNTYPFKYHHAYGDKISIQSAIDEDSYLRGLLTYNELGVMRRCYDSHLDYYHYQTLNYQKDDYKYVYSHRIEELATEYMNEKVKYKDSIKCLRKVIVK